MGVFGLGLGGFGLDGYFYFGGWFCCWIFSHDFIVDGCKVIILVYFSEIRSAWVGCR